MPVPCDEETISTSLGPTVAPGGALHVMLLLPPTTIAVQLTPSIVTLVTLKKLLPLIVIVL